MCQGSNCQISYRTSKSSRDGGDLRERVKAGSQIEFQGGDRISPPYTYILRLHVTAYLNIATVWKGVEASRNLQTNTNRA